MIKFIIPAIVVFLIVLFWEKINEMIYNKFNIKINYIVVMISILILGVIFTFFEVFITSFFWVGCELFRITTFLLPHEKK